MRPLSDLIDATNPGWPLVQGWLSKAVRPVEVMETTPKRGGRVLQLLQVTTRSPMGAIAFQSGGLLIDHGWVRVLGGGGFRMEGDLARWNGLGESPLVERFDGAMLVAHDVLGGFYALDGGAFGPGKGGAFYLAPDTLEWEDLGKGYSELVAFFLLGDLNTFYGDFRWPGWEREVSALSPDRGYAFYPPLFSEEGRDPAKPPSRKDVPMHELLGMNLEMIRQLEA